MPLPEKKYPPFEALQKIRHYCACRETTQKDVVGKLYRYGLSTVETENIVVQLIEEGFLNEERFACAYVREKFYFRKWGRRKILQELELKEVSHHHIKKGMQEIDPDEYEATMFDLIEKKKTQIRSDDHLEVRSKVGKYLIRKGYEPDLVWALLSKR